MAFFLCIARPRSIKNRSTRGSSEKIMLEARRRKLLSRYFRRNLRRGPATTKNSVNPGGFSKWLTGIIYSTYQTTITIISDLDPIVNMINNKNSLMCSQEDRFIILLVTLKKPDGTHFKTQF